MEKTKPNLTEGSNNRSRVETLKRLVSTPKDHPDPLMECQLKMAYLTGKLGKAATRELITVIGAPLSCEVEPTNESEQRTWAAYLLGIAGDAQAVMPLVRALDNKKAVVRIAVVRALHNIVSQTKDRRSVPRLKDLAHNDPCDDVRFLAGVALRATKSGKK